MRYKSRLALRGKKNTISWRSAVTACGAALFLFGGLSADSTPPADLYAMGLAALGAVLVWAGQS